MDRDQVEKSALIEALSRSETIVCRICLERDGHDWQVTQIIGDLNNPEPLESQSDFHSYESVTFVQDVFPTEEVCAWINNLSGKTRNLCFKLSEFHNQIRRERL